MTLLSCEFLCDPHLSCVQPNELGVVMKPVQHERAWQGVLARAAKTFSILITFLTVCRAGILISTACVDSLNENKRFWGIFRCLPGRDIDNGTASIPARTSKHYHDGVGAPFTCGCQSERPGHTMMERLSAQAHGSKRTRRVAKVCDVVQRC